ncbi:MFS transporter [Aestuariibacter salexigens]|uniref:MFS transporter n=1 Tax=Aestuariibacter salexigens TaxID=226010 RepID=UPI000479CF2E|nr:MFS transporter [Aestuariibacter salexigens]
MNALEIRAAASLAMVYVLRMLGLFMVMPVLAIYAADYPDYSAMLVGLAIGGYGLTQALLQIPMGMWSDSLGRKPVIVIGLAIFALGSIIAALADSMWTLVLGRIMQGAGAIAGAIMALAADVSREQQRPKVMAVIGIAIGFSFYLSLLVGPPIGQFGGLSAIFLTTAVLALCCIPIVALVVPTPTATAPSGDTLPRLADVKQMLRNPVLMRLNVSVLFLHMLITVFFVTVPAKLLANDLQVELHWIIYLPVLIASIIGMAVLMRVAKKSSISNVIIVAVLLLALAMAGLAVGPQSLPVIIVCCAVFFTGFNYLEANFPALVSNIAPAGRKGSAMGLYASFQFFGAFAGGVLSGLLTSLFSPDATLIVMIGLCLMWTGVVKRVDASDVLKRYTIQFTEVHNRKQTTVLHDELSGLAGVAEVAVDPQVGVVYLKVHGQDFDIQRARTIVKNTAAEKTVEE